MSRDKRKETGKVIPPAPISLDFNEPSETEIMGYAEAIGIDLPGDEDLLYIAREGIMADLPPGWFAEETTDGDIVYINQATGEETPEHPCDEFYRRLVVEEKMKKRHKSKGVLNQFKAPAPISGLPYSVGFAHSGGGSFGKQGGDVLLRGEQQKQLRRAEEAIRRQHKEKMDMMQKNHDNKKQELKQQHKDIQNKSRNNYDSSLQDQRVEQMKKMSEKERQQQEREQNQLKRYEDQLQRSLKTRFQRELQQQKTKFDNKLRVEKEKVKKQIEQKTIQQKQMMERKHKQRIQQLKQNVVQNIPFEIAFQEEAKKLRQQIVKKLMQEHSGKLRQQAEKVKNQFSQEITKLERLHEEQLIGLKSEVGWKVDLEQLVRQCKEEESAENKAFEFQLKTMEQTLRLQQEAQLQQFLSALQQVHSAEVRRIQKESEDVAIRFQTANEDILKQKVAEAQKRAKADYLEALRRLEQQHSTQQQLVQLQAVGSKDEVAAVDRAQRELRRMQIQEIALKEQLGTVRTEIESLQGQRKEGVRMKLNEQQLRLYQLISNRINLSSKIT